MAHEAIEQWLIGMDMPAGEPVRRTITLRAIHAHIGAAGEGEAVFILGTMKEHGRGEIWETDGGTVESVLRKLERAIENE